MRGVTTACLKEFGKDPSMREKFTNLVIEERRISRQSLRRNVGIGSIGTTIVVVSTSGQIHRRLKSKSLPKSKICVSAIFVFQLGFTKETRPLPQCLSPCQV